MAIGALILIISAIFATKAVLVRRGTISLSNVLADYRQEFHPCLSKTSIPNNTLVVFLCRTIIETDVICLTVKGACHFQHRKFKIIIVPEMRII